MASLLHHRASVLEQEAAVYQALALCGTYVLSSVPLFYTRVLTLFCRKEPTT